MFSWMTNLKNMLKGEREREGQRKREGEKVRENVIKSRVIV